MGKILVVEDDQFFREAIVDLLESLEYKVLQAENGKKAQDIFLVEDIDLVISDIQMPNLTGVELLKWCKEKKASVPFMLMTGFSMILETQSAFDLGADDFITKPFNRKDFVDKVERITTSKDASKPVLIQNQNIDEKYCRVPIDEFVSRPTLEFDIYIRFAKDKYTKIANMGETVDRDRLTNYKNKGVSYLYLLKDDFKKLIELNLNLSRVVKNRNDISNDRKMAFFKYTGELILEKAFSTGVDESSFTEAEQYLKITTDALTDSQAFLNLLEVLNQHSDEVYAHSVGVALFSTMIAKNLGFGSSLSLNKITMAALFHDIGKKEIDKKILEKPRYLQTAEERMKYEEHSDRGREILESIKTVSHDVIQIVEEHHFDYIDQNSYALNKNKKKPHPLTRIVHCANIFVEHTMKTKIFEGCEPKTAIASIESQYANRIDPESIQALKKIFKMS